MATKVRLLRPLDGKEAGSIVDYPDLDAKRLEKRGAVQILNGKAAPAHKNKMTEAPLNKGALNRNEKDA